MKSPFCCVVWLAIVRGIVRIADITKSPHDQRSYLFVRLDNGLEALLVSDPTADKAAAAMAVGVGSYANPVSVPGLAHFLEHMLFMGTQKYPDESEYMAFLEAHGGYANAYTAKHHTNYFFEVDSSHLSDVLDRFAQFFTAPLLRQDCIDREMKAVHSEHEKNLGSDAWRLDQVSRLLFDQGHPESKFSVGTIDTLNVTGIRESLVHFYESHYSSDQMKLVIVGRESVEALEGLAAEKFSAVPKRPAQPVHLGDNPFGSSARGRLMKAKAVAPGDLLSLTFQLPATLSEYQSKSVVYLSRMIAHGGAGGLSFHLKKDGLATKVMADVSAATNEYTLFEVKATLTEKGYLQYKRVIATILKFVDLLRSDLPDSIFADMQRLMNVGFTFAPAASPVDLASGKAEQMLVYAPRDILSGPFIIAAFDKQRTGHLAGYLRHDNMMALLASNRFDDDAVRQTERWYGTKYAIEALELPEEATPDTRFALPKENIFIPTNFSLVGTKAADPKLAPSRLTSSRNIPVWHKLDDTFMLPHSQYSFVMHSPSLNGSAGSTAVAGLWVSLFMFQSDERLYESREAGMACSMVNSDDGLVVVLEGYSDRMPAFIQLVGGLVSAFQPDPHSFHAVKAVSVKRAHGFGHRPAIALADHQCSLAIQSHGVGVDELVPELERATVEQLAAFSRSLLSASLDVEALVMGNVGADDAVAHVDAFMDAIVPGYEGTNKPRRVITNSVLTSNRPSVLVKRVIDDNFAAYKYIQLGEEASSETRAMVNLIVTAFRDLVFQVLRTEQSLGYIASMKKRLDGQLAGIVILVQSADVNPIHLDSRIDDLIGVRIARRLEELRESDYRLLQQSVINALTKKPANLDEESDRYMQPIDMQTYDFTRRLQTIVSVQATSLQAFKRFVSANVIQDRKSLSIHAWPNGGVQHDYYGMQPNVYHDYKAFRSEHNKAAQRSGI